MGELTDQQYFGIWKRATRKEDWKKERENNLAIARAGRRIEDEVVAPLMKECFQRLAAEQKPMDAELAAYLEKHALDLYSS